MRISTNTQTVQWPAGLCQPWTTSKPHLLLPAWAAPHKNTNPVGVSPRKPGDTPVLPEARGLNASHIPESLRVAGKSERVERALLPLQGQQFPISGGCCCSLDTICCDRCWWPSNRLFSAGLKPDRSQSTTSPYLTLTREAEDHCHFGPLP